MPVPPQLYLNPAVPQLTRPILFDLATSLPERRTRVARVAKSDRLVTCLAIMSAKLGDRFLLLTRENANRSRRNLLGGGI